MYVAICCTSIFNYISASSNVWKINVSLHATYFPSRPQFSMSLFHHDLALQLVISNISQLSSIAINSFYVCRLIHNTFRNDTVSVNTSYSYVSHNNHLTSLHKELDLYRQLRSQLFHYSNCYKATLSSYTYIVSWLFDIYWNVSLYKYRYLFCSTARVAIYPILWIPSLIVD